MKNQKQMPQIASSRTPVEQRLMQRLRYAPLGACLSFEQFLELAKCGRRAAGHYEQMAHIISCPACRRTYLALRVILQAQCPSLARWLSRLITPRLPQWAMATGFAGVVFAFAVWALHPKPASRHSDKGETVLEEELPATQTQFQLRALASGNEYERTLSAPRGERATLKTEIRFRVMSKAQRAQLRWARQNSSEAPLVAGLFFYQLERYQEALDALQHAQRKYPNDEAITCALNNLRARTRR